MSREKNVEIFKDTIERCSSNSILQKAIVESINKGFVQEKAVGRKFEKKFENTHIEAAPLKTTVAARIAKMKNQTSGVCMLNFASATHPGGGVERGASTQEENMCRCTTLYPVISNKKFYNNFYRKHKGGTSAYTETCIYTPGILIIKDENAYDCKPFYDFWEVDVVTCAAPNLRSFYMTNSEQLEAHIKRANNIMEATAKNGNDILIVGAFGCGAFRNNPEVVATAWKTAIQANFDKVFSQIIFAIPYSEDWDEEKRKNYEVFKRVLGGG